MTVSNTTRTKSYTGTGGLTRFAVPYQFFELGVYVDNELQDPSTYTIEQTDEGLEGTVVFDTAPVGGAVVTIKSATEAKQETDYVENDAFPAASHEKAIDRLTMAIQDIKRDLGAVYGVDWLANPNTLVTVGATGEFAPSTYSTSDLQFLFSLSGVTNVFATKAAMDAGAGTVDANEVALVLIDETHATLPTMWQKVSGTMTYLRTMPFAQLGNVVDAGTFGVSGGADETTKLLAIRQYLLTRPGCTLVLPAVEIQSQTPKWLAGVSDVTIVAIGTSFRNLGAATYGGSDMVSSLYLGSGPYSHTMTIGSVIDGAGSPMGSSTVSGEATPSITIESGRLIDDAAYGATTVDCLTTSDAAEFEAGDKVFISWYSRQSSSFPANPGYFEYNEVESVNTGTGVITLKKPLSNSYKKQAPDDTTFGVSWGAARITCLNRDDFSMARNVTLIGGKGIDTGVGTALYRGVLYTAGVSNVRVIGADFYGFFPTMTENVYVRDCNFHTTSEIDKGIINFRMENSRMDTLTQGTGLINFEMIGGMLTGASAQMLARNVLYDGVLVLSQGTGGDAKQIGRSSYPCRRHVVRNCTFRPDASQTSCVQAGNVIAFTPDAVSATTIQVDTTNTDYDLVRYEADIGQHMILNLSGSGANNEVFTITDVGFDASNNLVLTGWSTTGATVTAASTARLLYNTNISRADHESNVVIAPPAKCRLQDRYQRVWDGADADGPDRKYEFLLKEGDYRNVSVNGWLKSVEVDVIKPYTGSDAACTITIGKEGPGTMAWGGLTLNGKNGGSRFAAVGTTRGAASGDTLNNITQNMFVKDIILHLQGSAGTGAFSDGSANSLPYVLVTVTVATIH